MESTISSKIATIGADSIRSNQFTQLVTYWFGYPGRSSLLGLALCGLVTLVVLLAVILVSWQRFKGSRLTPPQKKFLERILWSLGSFPLFGLILLIVRFFGVPWLSMRFLWVVWALSLGFVVWLMAKYYLEKLPSQVLQYESYKLKSRYMFSKKKKRSRS